jgi:uncharacterized phage protein (TIGR01671 family)
MSATHLNFRIWSILQKSFWYFDIYEGAPQVMNNCIPQQSTGFIDKDGTEIFEGDIVESKGFSSSPYHVNLHSTKSNLIVVII